MIRTSSSVLSTAQANPTTSFTMAIQGNIKDIIMKVGNFSGKGVPLVFAEQTLKTETPLKSIPFYDNSNGCFDLRVQTPPKSLYPSYSYSRLCYEFGKTLPPKAILLSSVGSVPRLYTFDFFPCLTVLTTYKKTLSSGEKYGILFIKKIQS